MSDKIIKYHKPFNRYENQEDLVCCYNCAHSFLRMGVSMMCEYKRAWVGITAVQPIGRCAFFEQKPQKPL